eukprot:scaffold72584_cov75-Phaeocystis_antarctica.AAC.6
MGQRRTCRGASAAQSRRAPYWVRARRGLRRVGAAGVLHHWHPQLRGAVAKRSARRRREKLQRHESPDGHSSSLLHVVVTG